MPERPEWGKHDPGLTHCDGTLNGVGLPYAYFYAPSEALLTETPEVRANARFLPKGFQLLQCSRCSIFEYGVYDPFAQEVKIPSSKGRLPVIQEFLSAWEPVNPDIRRAYRRARLLMGERPNGTCEEGLGQCRVCLEKVVSEIASRSRVSLPTDNLYRNIEFLGSRRLLNSKLRLICDQIRKLANPAVHGGRPVLSQDVTRDGRFDFEVDGTVALFCLEALIAHVFLHPFLQTIHRSTQRWIAFSEWLNSVSVGPGRAVTRKLV
jgi:hypothetical protein